MATEVRERVYQRPWLADYQTRALFGSERYAVIEASTKSGKTVAAMAWLLEQALLGGRPGRHYWWVAPIHAQARIAFRRMKIGLPVGECEANETEQTIALPSGAMLWFKGAEHADGLFGEDVHAAVIDEASRVREESWHAVRSTLTATRGQLRVIGNVKGRRNWAYRLARRAESGDPEMTYARVTAHDAVRAGILSADEIGDAERMLPAAVFRELYLAEPSDDQGNPFGLDAIRARIAPLSHDAPVCFGIDLAKSTDFSVCIGLDAHKRVCHLSRFQRSWQDTIRVLADTIGTTPALCDSTGVGDPVLEALQAAKTRAEGFKFTQQSKQQLCEGLAVAIQRGEITYPDGVIVAELEQFEYVYSRTGVHYAAPEGAHDDAVCALALAVEQASRGRRWISA